MTAKPSRIGGSRFLYEPFDAANARIDANERVNDERWAALERRLHRLEEVIDRVERRMWLALSGVAGFLAADIAISIMKTVP